MTTFDIETARFTRVESVNIPLSHFGRIPHYGINDGIYGKAK